MSTYTPRTDAKFHFSRMARPAIVASLKTGGLVTNRERVQFPYACPFPLNKKVVLGAQPDAAMKEDAK